ncbi:MAG: DUF4080 domain-containing protein [Verrucomicrobia bacterium]|nr:DUF4080 domain-containing protein [Verrucomicrobiota bacterium]
MPDIVLTTINARFIHAAFGLRCLFANLGDLQARAEVMEFDLQHRALDIVERLLARSPRVVGFGVYIWNVQLTTQVVTVLKRLRPDVQVVLGGPEVSHEADDQEIVERADFVLQGEADLSFALLCRQILESPDSLAGRKIIESPLPALEQVKLAYDFYTDDDLKHRVIYVEASRGCPFTCEFCLSSLDVPVRQFPLDAFLPALQRLLDRGLNHFKFVDRTFNLNLSVSRAILGFFLRQHQAGRFYHFEMIPDRLPEGLREIIRQFPAGSVQFEVGVQTLNPDVGQRISRRQNVDALKANFRFLRAETGVHIHADLIVGLPGEDMASFGAGFDQLVALKPQEIQVGILKKLRGTPIARHDEEWGMVYHRDAPYEILRTRCLSFEDMQRLRRFARYWDLVANSGEFARTLPLLWGQGEPAARSPFWRFLAFSDWAYSKLTRTDQIALVRWTELLFEFLVSESHMPPEAAACRIWEDYSAPGRRDPPDCLRPFLPLSFRETSPGPRSSLLGGKPPPRQSRHLQNDCKEQSMEAGQQ